MRKILKIFVFKVYVSSFKAQDNVVNVKYIIMRKMPSIQLSVVWAKIRIEDRLIITKAIAQY